jgi:hypothetical protein
MLPEWEIGTRPWLADGAVIAMRLKTFLVSCSESARGFTMIDDDDDDGVDHRLPGP